MKEEAIENGVCRFCKKPVPREIPIGALRPGTDLAGHYLVGQFLGVGGYGITYRALELNTGRMVAIKEYRPQPFCERAEDGRTITVKEKEEYQYGLKHFYAEAEILKALLAVPEVVHYEGFFEQNNTAYYVMEFLEGETLQQYLKRNREKLSYYQTVELLLPAILALQKVHDAGILHRDISPDNIFLCKDNSIRLIDFGASKAAQSRYANSFMPVEKEGFSPPEQHTLDRDGTNQGPWSDVYAMAGTIYRCAVGKRPPSASNRIAGDPLEFRHSGLTEEQISVLEKNLSLRIDQRCRSMQEFAETLAGALPAEETESLFQQFPGLIKQKSEKKVPVDPVPPEPDPVPATPSRDYGLIARQGLAYCVDLLLFLGVPFAASRLLGGSILLWLLAGYLLGVFTTAFLMRESPGEILCGLKVVSGTGSVPDRKSALLRSAVRLFLPIKAAEWIYSLRKGMSLSRLVSGCRSVKAERMSATSAKEKSGPVLHIKEGRFRGSTLQLKPGKFTFGRNPDECNMVFPMDYATVSRVHFVLAVDKRNRVSITDLSSYGTWVNGSRIEKGKPIRLTDGSLISFGNQKEKMVLKYS